MENKRLSDKYKKINDKIQEHCNEINIMLEMIEELKKEINKLK